MLRVTVDHISEAVLVGFEGGMYLFAVLHEVHRERLRDVVIVPHVVDHRLIHADDVAVFTIEAISELEPALAPGRT